MFVVCYDSNASWKRPSDGFDCGVVDATIVATHLALAITNEGLGSTWVGNFDPQLLREALSIPEEFIPVALLPAGKPAAMALPSPTHTKRLPLEKTAFFDTFPG